MRKFLLLLASTATLATVDPARTQMLPPTLGGTAIGPGYTTPGYTPPGYTAPGSPASGYTAPGPPAPGYTAPGYMWREQQANQDWRNNTWREQRYNEDWRTNNWRQQRANEDWRQREEYDKARTPNNAIDRGYVEPDQATKPTIETKKSPLEKEECGTLKSSIACPDYVKEKTKNSAVNATKSNAINRGYGGK